MWVCTLWYLLEIIFYVFLHCNIILCVNSLASTQRHDMSTNITVRLSSNNTHTHTENCERCMVTSLAPLAFLSVTLNLKGVLWYLWRVFRCVFFHCSSIFLCVNPFVLIQATASYEYECQSAPFNTKHADNRERCGERWPRTFHLSQCACLVERQVAIGGHYYAVRPSIVRSSFACDFIRIHPTAWYKHEYQHVPFK